MSRRPVPAGRGGQPGGSSRESAPLAEDSFDFEVVPSRRRQKAGRAHRKRGEASDDADRRRAAWDVPSL